MLSLKLKENEHYNQKQKLRNLKLKNSLKKF